MFRNAARPFSPEDDSATLHDRLAQLGAELLAQTIPDYVAGKIQPVPQPAAGASYAAKIKKEDGRIDWNQPARNHLEPAARLHALARRVHVFAGGDGGHSSSCTSAAKQPGSDEALPPQLLKIWKAEVVESSGGAGEILSADKTGIVVGCGEARAADSGIAARRRTAADRGGISGGTSAEGRRKI